MFEWIGELNDGIFGSDSSSNTSGNTTGKSTTTNTLFDAGALDFLVSELEKKLSSYSDTENGPSAEFNAAMEDVLRKYMPDLAGSVVSTGIANGSSNDLIRGQIAAEATKQGTLANNSAQMDLAKLLADIAGGVTGQVSNQSQSSSTKSKKDDKGLLDNVLGIFGF